METSLLYLTVALSAITLLVTILLAIRLKTVHYLLQQPVVKKMSPQLRLKPVKLDEALGARNRDRSPGGREGDRREGSRPERRDGREGRPERSDRPEGGRERGEGRRDGERREGREGRPERREGDRREGGRPERRDGERREGRPERSDRPEGGRERSEGRPERRDGDRREGRESRPPREFSDAPRESAPAASSASSDYAAPASEAPTGLPPRRPLPSFTESTGERAESSAPFRDREPAADTFVGSGDDVQHGRRTQLKKKPRFDIDEAEAPAPTV